ncbi:MAG TPA: agmatinase [Solirubrobacterales bacterium]|nr:agmatinase [Solirubrobacterales bacterium]
MSASEQAPSDPTMWDSLLHAGLSNSFMRLPHVPPTAEAIKEHGAKAAIYGIPFDATNISRTGANYGPRGIRDVSCQFLTFNATLGFDLLEALNPVDTGDTDIVLANAEKTFERSQRDLGQIIESGALPVTFGGDHSITIPAVRAIRDHHEDPGLVLVDMHLDTAPDVGGELLNHCCPVTRAVDAGFDPEKIALVGISGWMNPKTELAYCEEHGITIIWLEEIWEKGTAWAADKAREVAGAGDGIYLSFDVDSLDAAHAPGTCCPSPGGLTSREAIELVRGVSREGLLGVDVVEVAPSLDPSPATALIGGRIALEAMAFHAGAELPASR